MGNLVFAFVVFVGKWTGIYFLMAALVPQHPWLATIAAFAITTEIKVAE